MITAVLSRNINSVQRGNAQEKLLITFSIIIIIIITILCMPWYIASCNEWRHPCQHLTRSFVGVSVVFCGMVLTPYLQYVAMSDC